MNRWRIAHWLDRLPFLCWSTLASWAAGHRSLREVERVNWKCRDYMPDGRCYCSKVGRNLESVVANPSRTNGSTQGGSDGR